MLCGDSKYDLFYCDIIVTGNNRLKTLEGVKNERCKE